MILTRPQLAEAIKYWGEHGEGGEPGLTLPRQASKLVTTLAEMDFARQPSVELADDGERAQLVREALGAKA